jgi:trimeric autotransporter adhesin
MHITRIPRIPLIVWLVLLVAPRGAAADSAFRYQGILTAGSQPASGLYDLAFSLHPAPDGIEQLSSPLTNSAIALQDGLFTTDLDFGITPFTGADLWLEIQVRPTAGDDPFVTLNPRQRLAPTPYALHAFAAQNSAQADVALSVPPDSVTALQIAPESITGDRLANAQVVRSLNGLRDELLLHAGDNLSLSTTGNSLTFTGSYDWSLTGNADTLPGKNFVGTSDPQPLEFKVNNNRALRLEPTSFATVVNVIGGSSGNFVRPGTTGATIAGGGAVYPAGSGDFANAVHAEFGTIGGGYANWIGTNAPAATIAGGHLNSIERDAAEATIGGGLQNKIAEGAFRANIAGGYLHTIEAQAIAAFIGGGISNMVSSYYSTVGGGSRNRVASSSPYSTVSGGGDNIIAANSRSGAIGGGGENQILSDSWRSTIAGGKLNQIGINSSHSAVGGGLSNRIAANADRATIPGGSSNLVSAPLSLAAGYRAHALHTGTLVWADSSETDFVTTTPNEFAVRATGGARFVSAIDANGDPSSGVLLESGGGSWSTLSDRGAKTNFTAIQSREILEKLAALPIQSWNYRSQPDQIRHLGPTAQDFHAAFGLGGDPMRITSVDADGVALAAIQGLHDLLEEKSNRITALESHNASLEKRLELLEHRLSSIVAAAPTSQP